MFTLWASGLWHCVLIWCSPTQKMEALWTSGKVVPIYQIITLSWRCKQHVPPRCQCTPTTLQCHNTEDHGTDEPLPVPHHQSEALMSDGLLPVSMLKENTADLHIPSAEYHKHTLAWCVSVHNPWLRMKFKISVTTRNKIPYNKHHLKYLCGANSHVNWAGDFDMASCITWGHAETQLSDSRRKLQWKTYKHIYMNQK
jgi:hypothetical protein